jgi:DNA invertase Pin-like site-specific DNA recombinase
MKKAVIYMRSAIVDPKGIDEQRQSCFQVASAISATVDTEFCDNGQSGNLADRPALQGLLEYCATQHVDLVIVDYPHRLARNWRLAEKIIDHLIDNKISLVIASYPRSYDWMVK